LSLHPSSSLEALLYTITHPLKKLRLNITAHHLRQRRLERKLVLDMKTEPVNIKQGDDVLMTIGFLDEGKSENILHVTIRMDISKDGKHTLSDFFHDHNGEVKLMFKNKGGGSSSHAIGGNQDVLTNAWIADPGSPIMISGPVFNQSGTYNVVLELSTIDNDKTDLVEPLEYTFDLDVS
jgi:hypothetical protein